MADYASLGLTLGRHPLALLRKRLDKMRLLKAEELKSRPHGTPARAAGPVTCRQRPDTASGVVFVTLEDETGCMNIVVWRHLVETQRRELLGARLLGVRAWSSATARSCTWSPGASGLQRTARSAHSPVARFPLRWGHWLRFSG